MKILFFKNFVKFYLILFNFKKNFEKFCDEQCSFSDSGTVLSPKTELGAPGAHLKPRLHAQACVPAQASICHNTAEPTVCLLSLLYATIQPSLLYACLAFYMPQYSRAYYMPAQAAVCLLRPLYACSGCCMPAKAAVCLLRPLYACSGCCMPAKATICLLRLLHACSGCCSPGHNTPYCISRQTQPAYLSAIHFQPTKLYCNTVFLQYNPSCNTISSAIHFTFQ